MTNQTPSKPASQWQDLYWLLVISRTANLREAAVTCGVSAATLSRHITALERDLKVDIFVRDSRGYTLTPYGQRVLNIIERMDLVASEIDQLDETGTAVVRLAAGSWMSLFLAKNVDAIQFPEDGFTLEWITSMKKADIARRYVHIGIRNSRPEESKLAGRRLLNVAFAVYKRKNFKSDDETQWITVKGGDTPSSRWVMEQAGTSVSQVNEPTLVLPMVLAGKGRAVFPCFIGDLNAGLERVGEVIEALTHEQWLVVHHSDRHLTEVRLVLDRLATLIKENEALFAGDTV